MTTVQELQDGLDKAFPVAVNVRLVYPSHPGGDADVDFVCACVTVLAVTDTTTQLSFGALSNNGKVYSLTGEFEQVQTTPFLRFEFKPTDAPYVVWFWPCPSTAGYSPDELAQIKANTRETANLMAGVR